MEALIELTELISQNPSQFAEKLEWICGRCLPKGSLSSGSHRLTRLHLNAVLVVARFISKCPNHTNDGPRSQFLQSIQSSFRESFWPQSFGIDSISVFYSDFLSYVAKVVELSPDFAMEIVDTIDGIQICTATIVNDEAGVSRLFFKAVSQNCLPILPKAVENLVYCLLGAYCWRDSLISSSSDSQAPT
ncbi:hypothetical protein NE237_017617 [Protea cynaroides]|uniref:Uncharacterized protein n=1 Tax=Protea cynaroides TaxID=273540 RepID=A0A9Q0K8C8_9MAGN|nr:hypothetical protein NE237_017617 [Protea cynaroides]